MLISFFNELLLGRRVTPWNQAPFLSFGLLKTNPSKEMANQKPGKDILAKWRTSAVALSPKYVLDSKTKGITIEDFEIDTKDTVNGDWHFVKFTLDGEKEPFQFPTHRNKLVETDVPVKIVRMVAKEDFTATNGKLVKEGTEKWVAMQS